MRKQAIIEGIGSDRNIYIVMVVSGVLAYFSGAFDKHASILPDGMFKNIVMWTSLVIFLGLVIYKWRAVDAIATAVISNISLEEAAEKVETKAAMREQKLEAEKGDTSPVGSIKSGYRIFAFSLKATFFTFALPVFMSIYAYETIKNKQ